MLAYELEGVESPFWHTKSLLSIYSFGFLYTSIYTILLYLYTTRSTFAFLRGHGSGRAWYGPLLFVSRLNRARWSHWNIRSHLFSGHVCHLVSAGRVGLKPCWMCRLYVELIKLFWKGKQIPNMVTVFLIGKPGKALPFLVSKSDPCPCPNGVQRTIWEQFLPHLQAEGWCVCFL